MMGIEERLKELRGEMSQATFSKKIGIKQTTYSKYERGISQPTWKALSSICITLGVNPRWIMYGEEPKFDNAIDMQNDIDIALGKLRSVLNNEEHIKSIDELNSAFVRYKISMLSLEKNIGYGLLKNIKSIDLILHALSLLYILEEKCCNEKNTIEDICSYLNELFDIIRSDCSYMLSKIGIDKSSSTR